MKSVKRYWFSFFLCTVRDIVCRLFMKHLCDLRLLLWRLRYDCYAVLAAPAARFIKSGQSGFLWMLIICNYFNHMERMRKMTQLLSYYLILKQAEVFRTLLGQARHGRSLRRDITVSHPWPGTVVLSDAKMKETSWATGHYSSAGQAAPVGCRNGMTLCFCQRYGITETFWISLPLGFRQSATSSERLPWSG